MFHRIESLFHQLSREVGVSDQQLMLVVGCVVAGVGAFLLGARRRL